MNGFINLYKPSGMTSAYALNKIKKLLGKKVKCGHMGTLDPMASGVLPVAIGKSTRLFDYLLDKDKVYLAEFTFGYETDTLDAEGKIVKDGGYIPTISEIEGACNNLIGLIDQIPPSYSAKNVGGVRSYVLARQGVAVELKPKKVEINQIIVSKTEDKTKFKFLIKCKGGTYIRSICRDIAYALNTYATMTALLRKKSGLFTEENAILASNINGLEDIKKALIKPEETLTYESITLSETEYENVINGRRCFMNINNGLYKVFYDNAFLGVGDITNGNLTIKAYIKD